MTAPAPPGRPADQPADDPVTFRPRYQRLDFGRNLVAGLIAVIVVVVAVRALPELVSGGDDEVTTSTSTTSTTVVEADEAATGRFDPTSLGPEQVWLGSRRDTLEVPAAVVEHRVLLVDRDATGSRVSEGLLIEVGAMGSAAPSSADPDQLAFEEFDLGREGWEAFRYVDEETGLVRHTLRTPEGRPLWVVSRGVDEADVLAVLGGISLDEPGLDEEVLDGDDSGTGESGEEAGADAAGDAAVDEAGDDATGEEAGDDSGTDESGEEAAVGITVPIRAGLSVELDEPADAETINVVVDSFGVPGDNTEVVEVESRADDLAFRPEIAATLDPELELVSVRGTVGVVGEGSLTWRERERLVLSIQAPGRNAIELVTTAEGLVELSEAALNARRPPVDEVRVVDDPTSGPEPSFDVATRGRAVELSGAVDRDPPFIAGQLAGPVVAVGRLEGTDVDVFSWRRGDGRFTECVGILATGAEAVLCLEDSDEVTEPRRMGVVRVTSGPLGGGRIHVWRVPGRAALASATVGGEALRQRPLEGIVVFAAPTDERVEVSVYDAEGDRI